MKFYTFALFQVLAKKKYYFFTRILLQIVHPENYQSKFLPSPNQNKILKYSRKDFQSMYKKIYPNSKSNKFSSRIFDVYDRNKDGFLDFEEFLIANKITSGNNLNEKLKMAFEIYDLKNDGVLDKKEMLDTFINIYTTVNIDSKENRKMAKEKVNIIFSKFVTKGNLLTLEEFIQCYSSDKHLNNVLNGTFLKEKPKISIQPRNQREFHMEKIERVLSI